MDSRLSELSSCLSIGSDDVCIIGICGMGGIGKTTIARSYYSCMSYRFEGSVFLANVKEVSSKHGMLPLQKQLLRKLVHRKIEIEEISDVYEVVEMIKTELRFKKVLIVIDDVDQLNQLEELAGERNWFGSGSRIIVTTRDVNLLVRLGVDKIYKVKGLNDDEALQLFSLKAFKCELVPKDYMMLSTSIVKYANGLPLALKVLGSFLFGKTMKEWRSAFARMKENPVREILDTLQISFDGLEETEKKIFLDIACFFKGKDTVSVTKIWDSCGFYPDIGISVLRDKCLITVLENSLLWMHDLLQALAWKIVQQESPREPGKRSRLWLSEDIFHVMTKNTGTEDVEGIVLELLAPVEKKLNAKALSKLTKLRLLVFCNVHFSLEQESLSHELEYLSNELRILKWHDYPYRNLPSSFHPEELIELDMSYSQVKQLWKGIKNFKKLKTIILSHSKNLVKTPDFRGVPNLEKLILEGCEKLYEIDQSIGFLEKLVLLNLKDCKRLRRLPKSMYGLKSLKTVNLSGCSKLEYRLEDLGCAECLEELDISRTAIKQASFFHFKKLRKLSLSGCEGQKHKSWWISLVNFSRGKGSSSLSLSLNYLSGLCSLVSLDLSDCNLLEVPSDLSFLSSLRVLNLRGNNLVSLPESISEISKLECLYLDHCRRLQSLQALPSNLNFVSAQACTSLEVLPERLDRCCFQSLELDPDNCFMLGKNQGDSGIKFVQLGEYKFKSEDGFYMFIHLNWKRFRSLQAFSSNPNFVTAQPCTSWEPSSERSGVCCFHFLELDSADWFELSENQVDIKIKIVQSGEYEFESRDDACEFLFFQCVQKSMLMFYELHATEPRFDIVFQGNQVPGWFESKSSRNSISIHLPLDNLVWSENSFLGFSLCAVFANNDPALLNFSDVHFLCAAIIKSDQKENRGFWAHTKVFKNRQFAYQVDHIWLFYLPTLAFLNGLEMPCNVEFKITVSGGDFEVKKLGVHFVHIQDVVEWHRKLSETLRWRSYDGCVDVDDDVGEFSGRGNLDEEPEPKLSVLFRLLLWIFSWYQTVWYWNISMFGFRITIVKEGL